MKRRNEKTYAAITVFGITFLSIMYALAHNVKFDMPSIFMIICSNIIAIYITLNKDYISPIFLLGMAGVAVTMLYISFTFDLDSGFETFLLTTALVLLIIVYYYFSVIYSDKKNIVIVGVAAIIERIMGNDKYILILKGSGRKALIEIPGGSISSDENMVLALVQKVREETGLTLTKVSGTDMVYASNDSYFYKPFHIETTYSGNYNILVNTFVCESMGSYNNDLDAEWIKIDELRKLMKNNADLFKEEHIGALREYLKYEI